MNGVGVGRERRLDLGDRRAEWGFDTSRPGESFVEVVRGVLVESASFFAGLGGPRPDRAKGPLVFAVICGLISFPLSLIVEPYDPLEAGQPGMRSGFFSLFRDNPGVAIGLAAVFVILLPLLVVLGVYVGAAVQHFFVFLFVRERRGYWGTFPVVAYGGGALVLFSWIPILGYLVSLYGVYITTVGLRELHGTSTTRALLASLVPTLLGFAALVLTLIYSPPGT